MQNAILRLVLIAYLRQRADRRLTTEQSFCPAVAFVMLPAVSCLPAR